MAKDRFLIAPMNTGLQTDVRPWLIADDAYARLDNVYVYKGRIIKRPGSNFQNLTVSPAVRQLYSRFAIKLGTTDPVTGNFGPTNIPGNVSKAGQLFSCGDDFYTVWVLGAPAAVLNTGPRVVVINLTVGGGLGNNIQIVGDGVNNLNTPVYFYPAEPVMGLYNLHLPASNDELTFGYDTQYGYKYVNGHWELMGAMVPAGGVNQPANAAVWASTDSDFMWQTNWIGPGPGDKYLYATNNLVTDAVTSYNGIKRYSIDANTLNPNTWANFTPVVDGTTGATLVACLSMATFKGCLIVANIVERAAGVDTRFYNKIRWSAVDVDPAAANNFDSTVNRGAGTVTVPVDEPITSISNVKDRLIIYCATSTWELVFTGNPAGLFLVQRINSQLGCESTYSPTQFDRATLGISQFGITACNGAQVERIDEKIITDVFQISQSLNGVQRVHGVRDFFNECIYWTFPNIYKSSQFPNQVLLYNYRNGSYATFDDKFTAFGYDENTTDLTWAQIDDSWVLFARPWNDPSNQQKFLPVLAGNSEGICVKIDFETNTNENAFYITQMFFLGAVLQIDAVNHGLEVGSYIQINNAQGTDLGGINGVIFEVTAIIDSNTFNVDYNALGTEVYNGGGTYRLVSQIGMLSKQFNLYLKDAYNCRIEKIQFNVDRAAPADAKIAVGISTNTGTDNLMDFPTSAQPNSVITLAAYALYPYEQTSLQLWRTVYINLQGNFVQYALAYTPEQMVNPDISLSNFALNAVVIHASPTSVRLQ